ncbi:uncharacterized protein LOC106359087 [Brassica napus]|uniref:uncharacterized protein LOC106359087 n=1 Tax=Brassica napus TaxID=3708 RepID=UPI002078D582|nr:uncharacterized protein LOC106359087 [Brassica napus]
MASGHEIYALRAWMYNHKDPETGEVTKEYRAGLRGFLQQATNQPFAREHGKIFCPCRKCKNEPYLEIDTVKRHLYNRGFRPNYYIWFLHGEGASSSSTGQGFELPNYNADYYDPREPNMFGNNAGDGYEQNMFGNNAGDGYEQNMYGNNAGDGYEQQGNRYHDMVTDALHEAAIPDSSREEPNIDAQRFYNMLDAANEPIYEGCREGLSRLSLASRMMTIKSDHNLNEKCMDSWAQLINEYLPEGNLAADNFYEIQKLVAGLGLPSEMIDVCIDNCMIYWKDDEKLTECRFCQKPRYQETTGRNPVPYKRMWYLPITDRLKRLYHSERTAASMRWHAQHSVKDGEITHPSDAKAWKHFQTVYSDFANEFRNVYLGLCTDGFSPFGMSGRQYSLWPVILTPYNLPPEMCMQREFLFLSILVPGPKHPKRALDVFLQPLIHELKMLWHHGVQTWDYSQQQNFNMRAVLMWTISDFPAYGMLSGWTTHGRLSCPYCMDRTDAFQLKNGRKSCWFDCHRRFLPPHHTYRKNKKLFRKNKVVHVPPPVMQPGATLLEQIDYYGAKETCKVGGNWHTPPNMPDGYTASHNWHKKSIFWELPYWKDHLLRHNLDMMHIEKNVFENIMNTLLDVKGKSKDNLKSRLDLPELCARPELHVTREGKLPVPNFRLSGVAKQKLFDWVNSDVNGSYRSQ